MTMGLRTFFQKLSGGDASKPGSAFCFILGADKRFYRRTLDAQGSHIQDNDYRMAYFSSPETNGVLARVVNGISRSMGPVSVAYELIPELFKFPTLEWGKDRVKAMLPKDTGGNGHNPTSMMSMPDPILDNSWAEGFSLGNQRLDNQETRNRLMHILLLGVLLAGALFLLVAVSTGLLDDFVQSAGKFFG